MSTATAPGPQARLAGINHLRAIRADFRVFSHAVHLTHGDVAGYRIFGQPVYQFAAPELAHEVLVEKARALRKPDNHKRAFGRVIGNNLFTSDGAAWTARRRMLSPLFLPQVIERYRAIVLRQTDHVLSRVGEGEVDVSRAANTIALLSVAESLFGAAVNDVVDEFLDVASRLQAAVNRQIQSPLLLPLWLPTRDNRTIRSALRFFDGLISPLITARRRSPGQHNDLLAALLAATDSEGGARLTDREAIDEAVTMLLAGSDTTAAALSWSAYLLAKHPDIQQQASAADEGFTECVFQEAMRLYPPAIAIARQAADPVAIGGVEVPRGALVFVSVYTIHHDPRWFPQPERFEPERFSAIRAAEIREHSYLPFGLGPRACIGRRFAMMEGVAVLGALVRRYRMSLLSPDQEPELETRLSLHPRGGLRLRLERR
jgi:cytochrome P450